jgi:alpha-pyrone synthase
MIIGSMPVGTAAEPPAAHIHAIGTAVPAHDVHEAFVRWAEPRLTSQRDQRLFRRMVARSGIEHRWSVLAPPEGGHSPTDHGGFYAGNRLPPTSRRMAVYADAAPALALEAIAALGERTSIHGITHLVVASCTGFVAPGIDQMIARRLGLAPGVERTLVGFMGCYAAVAALRIAHHIARSDANARILVVAVELSTLHLIEADAPEPLLAMLQFADGAAAAIVSAEPSALAMERFFSMTLPESDDLIRWTIGDEGFEMHLSGEVPGRIGAALKDAEIADIILRGRLPEETSWAVHAGGRSILDAVEGGLALPADALNASRSVLSRYGNMSSATLMFVLADMMAQRSFGDGIALAFGPGLAAEGFAFRPA